MTLESVVFRQDPVSSSVEQAGLHWIENWGLPPPPPPPSMDQSFNKLNNYYYSSSPEDATGGDVGAPVEVVRERKRRRNHKFNKEEMENQRKLHIAVERNRRKQMNDYLNLLRSLMPPSYSSRGDQASVVAGAINFVKELEQLLQSLQAQKQMKQKSSASTGHHAPLFADFFNMPQYTNIHPTGNNRLVAGSHESVVVEKKKSDFADIEVTMVESHANIKILSSTKSKQLLKLVAGFYPLGFTILHLNVTTVDHMVLYCLNVKIDDNCQLNTVNEIATIVHEMMGKIQEEVMTS